VEGPEENGKSCAYSIHSRPEEVDRESLKASSGKMGKKKKGQKICQRGSLEKEGNKFAKKRKQEGEAGNRWINNADWSFPEGGLSQKKKKKKKNAHKRKRARRKTMSTKMHEGIRKNLPSGEVKNRKEQASNLY